MSSFCFSCDSGKTSDRPLRGFRKTGAVSMNCPTLVTWVQSSVRQRAQCLTEAAGQEPEAWSSLTEGLANSHETMTCEYKGSRISGSYPESDLRVRVGRRSCLTKLPPDDSASAWLHLTCSLGPKSTSGVYHRP